MCGIAGILKLKGQVNISQFESMTKIISHRGPDDEGYLFANTDSGGYVIAGGSDSPQTIFESNYQYSPKYKISNLPDKPYNFALSNRRLAIFDLSPAGHQPMSNEDKSIWIVYNGEIYNFKEIRDELRMKGYRFCSDSDTEIVIKAYEEWDVDCLNKFNGMWAFCLWDMKKGELFCARDRLGVKPFYYSFVSNVFVFSSEIKSILQCDVSRRPNDSLIYDFLKYETLDHRDETFFEGIIKLPQAHYMIVDMKGNKTIKRYWDLDVSSALEDKYDSAIYAEEFRETFVDAVKLRLRSDVPVGSCLSGGLDSSSIVCVANRLMFADDNMSAHERQKTFSSCFEDKRFDEREYIEEVINKTQVEKNYIFPKAETFLEELDNLLWHQEEPFGGTSVYAQWCIFKKVREKGVMVMLDGQGADEQLGGYRKFYMFYFLELLKNGKYLSLISEFLNFFLSLEIIKTLNLRKGMRYFNLGNKVAGCENLLNDPFKRRFNDQNISLGYSGNLGYRIKDDLFKYSLPVLLRYEDKNSMAHSVEARLPFLDYRLVEKIASFPLTQKMKNGWTKFVLRNAMSGILPDRIASRKSKLGFVTPEDIWFKSYIAKEAENVFKKPGFIGKYVNNELKNSFTLHMNGNPKYKSDLFFRFFLLELWGRKFIL